MPVLHLGQSNIRHKYRLGDEWLEGSCAEGDLGLLIDSQLSESQQHALADKKANSILRCIKHSITRQSIEVIILLYLVLMRPHPEYYVQFCGPQFQKEVKAFECIQRSPAKLEKGLEGMSYEDKGLWVYLVWRGH